MEKVIAKVKNGKRLNIEEGLSLYDFPLSVLADLAQGIKTKRHKNVVTFIKNYYLSFTNICK